MHRNRSFTVKLVITLATLLLIIIICAGVFSKLPTEDRIIFVLVAVSVILTPALNMMKKIISGILRKGLLGEETENNPKEIKLDKDGNEITPLTDGAPQSDNILVQGIYNGVTAIGNFWLDAAEKTAVKREKRYYCPTVMAEENERERRKSLNELREEREELIQQRLQEQRSRYVYEDDDAAMAPLITDEAFKSAESSALQNNENNDDDTEMESI
jgi:hypothetical protein